MSTVAPGARPGPVRVWLMAIRPPTLTAAVSPVIVGSAVAVRDGVFEVGPAVAALFGAFAIQIGVNLANDVSDFRRGADTEQRIGPPRVTQQGLLTERDVMVGMGVAFALAAFVGLYLITVAGWPVAAVGAVSILAALTYTGGPWPYGYHGLGELFAFVFFGVVAVVGTYYVQAGEVTAGVLAASAPVGLTVTAILVVNNVRDIDTDGVAGKRTLAVRLGRRLARGHFVATLTAAYLAATMLWLVGDFSAWALLPWLSLPLAVAPVMAVVSSVEGAALNAALRATARLHLVFGALLAAGIAQ